MQLVYDDMLEFAEISRRCVENVENGTCNYCIFCDRCQIDVPENRHIFCGTIIDNGSVNTAAGHSAQATSEKSESGNAAEWQKMS